MHTSNYGIVFEELIFSLELRRPAFANFVVVLRKKNIWIQEKQYRIPCPRSTCAVSESHGLQDQWGEVEQRDHRRSSPMNSHQTGMASNSFAAHNSKTSNKLDSLHHTISCFRGLETWLRLYSSLDTLRWMASSCSLSKQHLTLGTVRQIRMTSFTVKGDSCQEHCEWSFRRCLPQMASAYGSPWRSESFPPCGNSQQPSSNNFKVSIFFI